MQDLQEVTQEVHYENYRSERLAKGTPMPKRNAYVCFLYSATPEKCAYILLSKNALK